MSEMYHCDRCHAFVSSNKRCPRCGERVNRNLKLSDVINSYDYDGYRSYASKYPDKRQARARCTERNTGAGTKGRRRDALGRFLPNKKWRF